MPRPCKCRWIALEAPASAFKPVGVPGQMLDVIELGLDELEALRLADLEGLYHDAAAERMSVSRPTFGRVLERARHKVALALLKSKMLVFKGGPVQVGETRTFACAACGATFGAPHGTGRPEMCPKCGRTEFCRVADARDGSGDFARRAGTVDVGRRRRTHRRRGPGCAGSFVTGPAEAQEDSR